MSPRPGTASTSSTTRSGAHLSSATQMATSRPSNMRYLRCSGRLLFYQRRCRPGCPDLSLCHIFMIEGVGMGRGSGSFPLPAPAARATWGRQKKCPRLNGEKVLGSLDKAREVYYEE